MPYSHAGVCVGDDQTIEAVPKGVVYGSMADHIKNDASVMAWENIYMTSSMAFDVHKSLELAIGKGYDWLESISYVVPVGEDPGAYNCVEVVMVAFKSVGLLPADMDPIKTSPLDLACFLESPRGQGYGWRRRLANSK